jgi:ferredoxin-NADP reductase
MQSASVEKRPAKFSRSIGQVDHQLTMRVTLAPHGSAGRPWRQGVACSIANAHACYRTEKVSPGTHRSGATNGEQSRPLYGLCVTGGTQQTVPWDGTVVGIERLSPQVTSLWIDVARPEAAPRDERFSFHAGQWIDLLIPGVDIVGGFSIMSAPHELPRLGIAVRRAEHPPAKWVHSSAEVGSRVQLRGGGSVWHDCALDTFRYHRSITLVGAGIGMSPLRSILHEWAHWRRGAPTASATCTLIQSASTASELVWRDETARLQASLPPGALRSVMAADDAPGQPSIAEALRGTVPDGPMQGEVGDLSSLEVLQRVDSPLWYVCGPVGMMDWTVRVLSEQHVPASLIRCERWT